MTYESEVLIKLRRQYGKDEYVAALLKQIKEKDFEIGVLKSEIDELRDKLKLSKERFELSKEARIIVHKELVYQSQKKHIKKLHERVRHYKELYNNLISKKRIIS